MTNVGACRLSDLITGLRGRLQQAHRRGPGTSQVRQASRGIGWSQPETKPISAAICQKSARTNSWILVRSAPVRRLLPGHGGRVITLAGAGATALAFVAGGGANPSPPAVARLRAQADTLAARSHRALLDIYSADTALASTRSRLATLQQQVSAVRAQRSLLARETAIATDAKRRSERRLAMHLTALYEQGQPDPLATILGATSLDEAVSNLDALNRVASQDRAVVRAAVVARRRLNRLSTELAARTAELQTAERRAMASLAALEDARTQRSTLLASLRSQERFTRGRIAMLEATARAAEAKTQQLAAASTPAPAVAATPTPAVAAPAASASPTAAPATGTITVLATGYSLPGRTSTGLPVGWGIAAVDPSVIPLGTHMTIPGYGEAVAADTGGGVRGAMIDLWFPTPAQARAWGRRTVVISLH